VGSRRGAGAGELDSSSWRSNCGKAEKTSRSSICLPEKHGGT
jgi:hypothetical protein